MTYEHLKPDILEQMSDGKSLRSICKQEGYPAASTVIKWTTTDKEFGEHYVRAREAQADALFDELAEVADAALTAETAVEVAARRLVIDTHKWRISKIVPKKYGDKLELAGDAQNPIGIALIERRVIDSSN